MRLHSVCTTAFPLTLRKLAVKMEGLNEPSRAPKSLLSFRTRADLEKYKIGVDSDIGGSSSARLDFVPDDPSNTSPDAKGKGRFWGEMRLGVRGDLKGKIRGGYAGFRSKVRTVFACPLRAFSIIPYTDARRWPCFYRISVAANSLRRTDR